MPVLFSTKSALLLIDFQSRLMPAIHDCAATLANARRLLEGARLLGVSVIATEQNSRGLGSTVTGLELEPSEIRAKMSFDAACSPGVLNDLPTEGVVVVAGCEAHVCVLQTVLGLLDHGLRVVVVADAIGSRRPESREAALRRLDRHGAEIVTTEMVLFEWIGGCEHPAFRNVLALVR